MKATLNKIKRLEPLISTKELEFKNEISLLNKIKSEKIKAIDHLRQLQAKYLEGVDLINQERQEGNLKKANTLSPGLDFVKRKWHDSLMEVQNLERKQIAQLEKVIDKQKELKTYEKLKEQYEKDFQTKTAKLEQKTLDEFSIGQRRRAEKA